MLWIFLNFINFLNFFNFINYRLKRFMAMSGPARQ